MRIPMQVTFRGMDASAAVQERVRREVAQLERSSNRITSCSVAVERLEQGDPPGDCFRVCVQLMLTGGESVEDTGEVRTHADVYAAIQHGFEAARRRLPETKRPRR
jgi:ribosome-associated translation inhibitor RaiA